jgi:hypothetical protein
MDLKMFVFPAIMLFQKKFVDLTVESNVEKVRIALFSVIAVTVGIYFIIYQLILAKKDKRKIWVPPKPQPTMPFSAPPPPAAHAEYIETTYEEHELGALKEAATTLATGCGIALFMSFKFSIHVSAMAQCLTVPLGLFEMVLLRVRV